MTRYARRNRGNVSFTGPATARNWKKTPYFEIELHSALRDEPGEFEVRIGDDDPIQVRHNLSRPQVDILLTGVSIPWKRKQREQRKERDKDGSG